MMISFILFSFSFLWGNGGTMTINAQLSNGVANVTGLHNIDTTFFYISISVCVCMCVNSSHFYGRMLHRPSQEPTRNRSCIQFRFFERRQRKRLLFVFSQAQTKCDAFVMMMVMLGMAWIASVLGCWKFSQPTQKRNAQRASSTVAGDADAPAVFFYHDIVYTVLCFASAISSRLSNDVCICFASFAYPPTGVRARCTRCTGIIDKALL